MPKVKRMLLNLTWTSLLAIQHVMNNTWTLFSFSQLFFIILFIVEFCEKKSPANEMIKVICEQEREETQKLNSKRGENWMWSQWKRIELLIISTKQVLFWRNCWRQGKEKKWKRWETHWYNIIALPPWTALGKIGKRWDLPLKRSLKV